MDGIAIKSRFFFICDQKICAAQNGAINRLGRGEIYADEAARQLDSLCHDAGGDFQIGDQVFYGGARGKADMVVCSRGDNDLVFTRVGDNDQRDACRLIHARNAAAINAYLIAIPIGIYLATHPGSFLDRMMSTSLFALYSIPTFWAGTLVLIYLTNNDYLISLFPTRGLYSTANDGSWSLLQNWIDIAWHLVAPVMIYTYTSFAFISRQMRAGMIEVVRQDYIRTARAKGLSERVVIYKHALRNSLIPIITLLAGLLPALVGGSLIVEMIFSIPGMGLLSFNALLARDYPVIMGVLTLSAVLTMFGVLFADLLYSMVDPRIAFAKKNA